MAKVVITLNDASRDNIGGKDVAEGVEIDVKFDPPIPEEGDLTLAQELATAMLDLAVDVTDVLEVISETPADGSEDLH